MRYLIVTLIFYSQLSFACRTGPKELVASEELGFMLSQEPLELESCKSAVLS